MEKMTAFGAVQPQGAEGLVSDAEIVRRIALYHQASGIQCITCLDYGTVGTHREVTNPVTLRVTNALYAATCPDCKGERVSPEENMKRRMRAAGISDSFWKFTFANWKPNKAMEPAYRATVAFADRPVGGLVLSGSAGVGKTHLAVAVAMEAVKIGMKVKFDTARGFLTQLQRSIGDGSYAETKARLFEEPDLVVLDDYGAERTTDYTADVMEEAVSYRYSHEKAFIVTTNAGNGDVTPRIESRLKDRSRVMVVNCEAPDYRPILPAREA
jgi:DNA replication protein DnaC